MEQQYQVIFQPAGRRGFVPSGTSILDAARRMGVEIEAICGEKRTCGKCKVKVQEGFFERYGIESRIDNTSPFHAVEANFINRDQCNMCRLSCYAEIFGDLVVFVPEESRGGKQVIRKSAKQINIAIDPAVRKYAVQLTPPTLHDTQGDFERLAEEVLRAYGLGSLTIDFQVLRTLPRVLREGNWRATVSVWMNREIILVEPGIVETGYGLAVDIGTTTVVGFLCDLRTGNVVGTASMMNPQVTYGEDVLSRLTYAMTNADGLDKLHRAIIEGLNQIVASVCEEARVRPDEIYEAVLVGNTAMHHLFLGIYPNELGLSPYPPASHKGTNVKPRDLGLNILPSGNVYVLPIEAGFVGADNVAVLIAEEPYTQDENWLIIDIGTNGELILGSREKLLSCSCATGPAFEGASIKFGMRAAPGAIEKVKIDPKTHEVWWKAIGDKTWHRTPHAPGEARGICGSGIIDAVAEMYRAGVIQKSGAFNRTLTTPRLRPGVNGKLEFVLAWADETVIGQDIVVTGHDVRQIQLAKAAMYSGAKLMMQRLGIAKPDKVILAGAFGSYIDKTKAMILGMYPDCEMENVYAVGNAAGDGARMALLNRVKREEAERMAREVEYVELSAQPEFEQEFTRAMHLPHMAEEFPLLHQYLRGERPASAPRPARRAESHPAPAMAVGGGNE
jgi:uncharacterized 2Fe-2S/4Fe-4S cluster protein (DUF4445 family)